MGLYRRGDRTTPRGPSLRGVVMQYVRNGGEVTAAWPKKRSAATKRKTAEQNEWFRKTQWAWKFEPANMQAAIMEARKSTPLLPRDLYTALRAGTIYAWVRADGLRVFPMQTIQAVSGSLDAITQAPGTMLVRGDQFWMGVPYAGGTSQSEWVDITWPDTTVPGWDGAGYLNAETQVQMGAGSTIEWEIKFKRRSGQQSVVVISGDGQHGAMFNNLDSGPLYIAVFNAQYGGYQELTHSDGASNLDVYATQRFTWTEGSTADGMRSECTWDSNGGYFTAWPLDNAAFRLTGITRPFWIHLPGGKADILMSRYRLTGPFPSLNP